MNKTGFTRVSPEHRQIQHLSGPWALGVIRSTAISVVSRALWGIDGKGPGLPVCWPPGTAATRLVSHSRITLTTQRRR
jgi:L-alanine-DL-glutamate epimerase-like enolase superfamily enzyme